MRQIQISNISHKVEFKVIISNMNSTSNQIHFLRRRHYNIDQQINMIIFITLCVLIAIIIIELQNSSEIPWKIEKFISNLSQIIIIVEFLNQEITNQLTSKIEESSIKKCENSSDFNNGITIMLKQSRSRGS